MPDFKLVTVSIMAALMYSKRDELDNVTTLDDYAKTAWMLFNSVGRMKIKLGIK